MKLYYHYFIVWVGLLTGCNSFLDRKSDIHMTIPKSLDDAKLLLNDYTNLTGGFPIYGELGTDDYYVTDATWNAASSLDQRNAYIWADEPYTDAIQWQRPYKSVYVANQVLDILKGINAADNMEEYARCKGAAHFIRAYSFHLLTELHCPAYTINTAPNDFGIPLRLEPGIDRKSNRANLKDTYDQIISDFKSAASYLPIVESVRGRPFKASAYAGLARAYLDMGDYDNAYLYADSCLRLKPELIDFNSLKATDPLPIPKFNIEVLYSALSTTLGIMGANFALMDKDLYNSYHANDLRKGIFFKATNNPPNSFLFKGSYDKSSANIFMGLTTSEVYLIKAEAACRIGYMKEALACTNKLLENRWNKNTTYEEITENDPDKLLSLIVNERRKELLFRGRRWADLKRLNLDPRFQKTLIRTLGEEKYSLAPNSPKYAYRLSETVINLAGLPQNKR
ncbi:RagB/SusD family nutrient uptake outer membrane protein [Sphingobacterium thalpophilum]|uniref:RagB/SusD family nutrient uptake outer membrane protein n=1 Tax=Sphingobacterium thalpophilum TaxID=259 RepID=A0ABV4HIS5_9SPHI